MHKIQTTNKIKWSDYNKSVYRLKIAAQNNKKIIESNFMLNESIDHPKVY